MLWVYHPNPPSEGFVGTLIRISHHLVDAGLCKLSGCSHKHLQAKLSLVPHKGSAPSDGGNSYDQHLEVLEIPHQSVLLVYQK